MQDFLEFFEEQRHSTAMHLEIYYSKVMDWVIQVYKKGCVDDGEDLVILYVQEYDMKLAFAKAQIKLKEWLLENEGGY